MPGLLTFFYNEWALKRNDQFDWTVTTKAFLPNHYQGAPYVSNGYFGQALPTEGVGYWVEKKPDGSPALNGEFLFFVSQPLS